MPNDKEITDFCPTEAIYGTDVKTHIDYHKLLMRSGLYKFDILKHNVPTILHKLQELTGINPKSIDLKDKETLELFVHSGDEKYNNSTKGIFEFGSNFTINMLKQIKVKNLNDLVCTSSLAHGSNVWTYNAENLIKNQNISVNQVISNRADIMNYLIKNGINTEIAYNITEFVTKGKAEKTRDIFSKETDREKYLDEWNKYKKILQEHKIPEWYIESCEKISYIFPKAHAIGYTINAFRIAWYKVHYPEVFYKVYFEVNNDIDINQYYTKDEVQRKLKKLYKEDKEKTSYNFELTNQIERLEVLLEMYNKGIKKDKKRKLDDYDLINSTAIRDYCREIGHKFNTEELAVLVYRNQKMSIDEKIAKYKDLIKNYPDMEVIERINCNHYDSVKDMIKAEITRLETLKEKLIKDEENSIYTFIEYNKSTNEWDKFNQFRNVRKTFDEIENKVNRYIDEYDDIYSYQINKRYFDREDTEIVAEYHVFDKKGVLVNIFDANDNWLDINNIFLNIPTPFKKGDILVSYCDTPFRDGILPNKSQIFVLEWLCTWRENLDEVLSKGGYDTSDMFGNGYCLIDYYGKSFVYDNMCCYDSFEYYDGDFAGMERLLKAISSLLQDKIGIEVFVDAYEEYKSDSRKCLSDCYSKEILKLIGYLGKDS